MTLLHHTWIRIKDLEDIALKGLQSTRKTGRLSSFGGVADPALVYFEWNGKIELKGLKRYERMLRDNGLTDATIALKDAWVKEYASQFMEYNVSHSSPEFKEYLKKNGN
ncbi:MAG: hypothetical protein WC595_01500 [Candidatus Nanoarchaeia archaeon]